MTQTHTNQDCQLTTFYTTQKIKRIEPRPRLDSKKKKKQISHFFTKQINTRSLGSRCIKGTKEFLLRVDSFIPLMHHDPRDLG